MRLVTRIVAKSRAIRLARQLRDIETAMQALPLGARRQLALLAMKEFANASRCEFPHLYGSPPEMKYLPWGGGTDIGHERARSDNPQMRMRGIALWLAVAFHETRDAPTRDLQLLHRNLLRVMRQLKENAASAADDPVAPWATTRTAAA
ncbi:MAG: hypothetical protein KGI40_03175 [Xanthomonadaceae bacterium]|nr:hypothetical protein [Xanthomonadaceae bacterium]MDE2244695.1 hypothetical protein [Xanthomonadaceae bacterium]